MGRLLAQELRDDWAWQAPRAPAPPVVQHAAWPRGDLDRFVMQRLEAAGLDPAPEADRRTLLRRLSFDLIGLPPTLAELDAFLADTRPDAYERVVDRLLASPHYGERMARAWLDVARFGESNGFEHDQIRPNAWPYREWLVDAFNQDLPYDEFARQQLAGDVIGDGDAAVATGFLVGGAYDSVGQEQQSAAMRAVVRQDELEDIVSTVGQTFLGMTVHCARCHDHKFDPIRQTDYYRVAAAFAGVHRGDRDVTTTAERRDQEATRSSLHQRLATLHSELEAIEAPVRAALQRERQQPTATTTAPRPALEWDFGSGLADSITGLLVQLHGSAHLQDGTLVLDGRDGYASTAPLPFALRERTLEADVELADLDQRGGAAISVQSPDGTTFDAIVFGEREPRRWMAGSDFFRRTQSFAAPAESAAPGTVVHIAIAWHADGTIAAYRDGVPYGTAYRTSVAPGFEAGAAQLLLGLRHAPPTAGKLLHGSLHRVALHVRALDASQIAALAAARSTAFSSAAIDARLPDTMRARRADLRAELARVAAEAGEPRTHLSFAVLPREPEPTHVLERGDPKRPGALVAPGGIASLPDAEFGLPPDASDAQRRSRLAAWITSPSNPAFARVMVNRIWQGHFGIGLVDTPSDFGRNGGRPSHPELLDWLASGFVASGCRMKALHRAIVLSATWRESARTDAHGMELDADARLRWRMVPRRLEAEALRDAILAVAGRLDPAVGGPSYRDFRIELFGATHTYVPVDPEPGAMLRRSLYRTSPRGGRSGFLDAFDCPDPSTTAPRRASTTTPLQALALRNDSFVLQMADALADRVAREAGTDVDAQVVRAFLLALGRPPQDDELVACRETAIHHGLPAVSRALFNLNEFLYVD